MITGFNTDVEYNGRVFHVQTEEKGPSNPIVVSLVYCGGEIITSLEASYVELVETDELEEDEVLERMKRQHQNLIREIRNGKFDPAPMPFGHDLISNRSVDELVLAYLVDSIGEASAESVVEDQGAVAETPAEDLQAAAVRVVKVGKVLFRLEKFLTAAQRAEQECEVAHAQAEIEPEPVVDEAMQASDEPVPEIEEPVVVEPETTHPARRHERRGPWWIWAAAAAAMIVGALLLFALRQPTDGEVSEPIPAATGSPIDSSPVAAETETPGIDPIATDPVPQPSPAGDDPAPSNGAIQKAEPRQQQLAAAVPSSRPDRAAPVTTETDDESEPESLSGGATTPAEVPEPAAADDESVAMPAQPEPQPNLAGQLVDLADVDLAPVARQRDLPRYTRKARRLGQQGVIELSVRVDERGEVQDVELVEGIPESDLNQAAIDVARSWKFSPARKNGEAVKVWKDVALEFAILPNKTTSVRIRD
jgi:TonB family protein